MSAAGCTVERPPPVPPPLCPNTGPKDGCRSVRATLLPMRASPWVRPTATVVLPSPAGVGVMAVTTTNRPGVRRLGKTPNGTFALWAP